jgi:hypothetical protein
MDITPPPKKKTHKILRDLFLKSHIIRVTTPVLSAKTVLNVRTFCLLERKTFS